MRMKRTKIFSHSFYEQSNTFLLRPHSSCKSSFEMSVTITLQNVLCYIIHIHLYTSNPVKINWLGPLKNFNLNFISKELYVHSDLANTKSN